MDVAGQHGAAGYEYGRYVDTGCRHQQTGHVLVTVGDHDQTVKTVGLGHALGGVGDQVPGDQRILHADVSHGNAVTYSNGREHNRCAAGHGNAQLDRLGDLVQVHVAGNDLIIRTYDTDQRPFPLLFGVTKRVEQASCRCLRDTVFYRITLHDLPLYMNFCTNSNLQFVFPD